MSIKMFVLIPILIFAASTGLLVNYGARSLSLASSTHKLNSSAQALIETDVELTQCIGNIDSLVQRIVRMEQLVSAVDIRREYDEHITCLTPLIARLDSLLISHDDFEAARGTLDLVADLRSTSNRWLDAAGILLGLTPSESVPTSHAFDALARDVGDTLDQLTSKVKAVPRLIRTRNEQQRASLYKGLVYSILSFAFLMTIAVLLTTRFSSAINRIASAMRELCAGNVEIDLHTTDSRGEIGRLTEGVHSFRKALMTVMEGEQLNARLANFDPLTNVFNRRSLMNFVHARIEQDPDSILVILKIDLDRFKQINDSLGHAAGDEFLKDTVAVLQVGLRSSDTVARLGGDEFVVVLVGSGASRAWPAIADALIVALRKPVELLGQQVSRSVSMGVSTYPIDGRTIDELLQNADIALYEAKSSGRNRCVQVTSAMIEGNLAKNRLSREIEAGIESKEFGAFFQPKVDIESGDIVGFEALVRWQHPERGLLSPYHFIEQAEPSHLILPIGELVLMDAIRATKLLAKAGLRTSISLNASARELSDSRFAQRFIDSLANHEIAPQSISVEMLESVALDNSNENISVNLNRLMDHGVKIWIDDFGVGYSTVGVLKHDFIHGIKVDRRFVCTADSPERDRTLLNAIVQMARNMGKDCILEGVETAEELNYTRTIGCRFVQGYYYARPMPLDDLVSWWLTRGSAASHRVNAS